jgi:hypothetical protein
MVQGKYALEDAYGAVPFMLRSINPKGSWLEVSSVLNCSESVYEIRIPFESQNASLIIQIIPIAIPLLQPVILLRDIPWGTGFLPFELETTNK